MIEFKEGDLVTLRKDSHFYKQCLDEHGEEKTATIKRIDRTNWFCYIVNWPDDENEKGYRLVDLKHAKPTKPKIDFLSVFTQEQKEALTNFINEQIETKLKKYE